jgi:hypothetical protein
LIKENNLNKNITDEIARKIIGEISHCLKFYDIYKNEFYIREEVD